MTHFGIICPAATGHLNPMTTLGHELKHRGHRVTLIGIEDAEPKAKSAGLEFQAIGKSDFPQGATKEISTQLGNLSGLKALQYTIDLIANVANMRLQDAPEVVEKAGIELLLVDQSSPEGGTVAEYLDIPFINVCSALMVNQELNIPPFNTSWDYDPSWRGILRNRVGYALLNRFGKSVRKVIDDYRQEWNLSLYHNPNQYYSQLAQLSQQPVELEFPRKELPSCFHFTGPYHYPTSVSRESIPFPYEKLTGKPLVYASLGTLQNRLIWIFQTIAEACMGLE
ncbi:MAG: glycosyltransferase, partial [Xenococcaceae cyanobacterium]